MRRSVRKEDPAYDPAWIGDDTVVLVDGLPVRRCHTADEERGEAICFAEDDRGRAYPDPDDPGKAKEVVLRGDVRIVPLSSLI